MFCITRHSSLHWTRDRHCKSYVSFNSTWIIRPFLHAVSTLTEAKVCSSLFQNSNSMCWHFSLRRKLLKLINLLYLSNAYCKVETVLFPARSVICFCFEWSQPSWPFHSSLLLPYAYLIEWIRIPLEQLIVYWTTSHSSFLHWLSNFTIVVYLLICLKLQEHTLVHEAI